jgi:hypothetical protein
VFHGFRRTNPLVLAAAAVWMVTTGADRPGARAEDRGWALALVALPALGHVNDFVCQLMHDMPADVAYWRRYCRLRPPLRQDLDAPAVRRPVERRL